MKAIIFGPGSRNLARLLVTAAEAVLVFGLKTLFFLTLTLLLLLYMIFYIQIYFFDRYSSVDLQTYTPPDWTVSTETSNDELFGRRTDVVMTNRGTGERRTVVEFAPAVEIKLKISPHRILLQT